MSTPERSVRAPAHRAGHEANRDLRIAWISLALLPVSFVAAMVLGQALLSLQGYESGGEVPLPIGAVLLAGLPAVLVLVAPTIPAMVFGFRARRLGAPAGIIPAVIGAGALVLAVLLNTLPLLLGG